MSKKALNRVSFIRQMYQDVGGPAARAPVYMHAGQHQFHTSTARFRTSVWGRRAGKTLSGGIEISPRLLSVHSDGYPHIIWIVCPNYDLGEREYRVAQHIKNHLGIPTTFDYYTKGPGGKMAFSTEWGCEVWVKSAENPDKSLLGEGLSFAIMAEGSRIPRSTWEQYIEPALADRNGQAVFTSTPQGHNFLKTLHDRGQSPDYPDWASFQFPSWINEYRFPGGLRFVLTAPAPNHPGLVVGDEVPWQRVAAAPDMKVVPTEDSNEKLVNSWKTLTRHFFWQEYGAQFRTRAGLIYPDFDPGYHVKPLEFLKGPDVRNYRTIDYGTTNPFVCLDIQVDEYGNVRVWREWRRTGHSTLDNARWVKTPAQLGYALHGVVGDPYEPDGRLTTENEWEFPVQFVALGVKNGIELVERRLRLHETNDGMRPRLFIDPQCTGLIAEMQAYRWKETMDEEALTDTEFIEQQDRNPREDPMKANDHAPDALRNFLAWYEGDTLVHHAEQDQGINETVDADQDLDPTARRRRQMWEEVMG